MSNAAILFDTESDSNCVQFDKLNETSGGRFHCCQNDGNLGNCGAHKEFLMGIFIINDVRAFVS